MAAILVLFESANSLSSSFVSVVRFSWPANRSLSVRRASRSIVTDLLRAASASASIPKLNEWRSSDLKRTSCTQRRFRRRETLCQVAHRRRLGRQLLLEVELGLIWNITVKFEETCKPFRASASRNCSFVATISFTLATVSSGNPSISFKSNMSMSPAFDDDIFWMLFKTFFASKFEWALVLLRSTSKHASVLQNARERCAAHKNFIFSKNINSKEMQFCYWHIFIARFIQWNKKCSPRGNVLHKYI